MGTYLLAGLAGLITSFSPCVVSALPLVVGSALGKNKYGPAFLAAGLVAAFVAMGTLFAASSGLTAAHQEKLRIFGGYAFVGVGLFFVVPKLSVYLALLLGKLANKSSAWGSKMQSGKWYSMLALGALLGLIWSPCSGPTLGLAFTLVAKQGNIAQGMTVMAVFSIAAIMPLLFVAYISRNFIQRHMQRVDVWYGRIKYAMGGFMILLGVATITGLDHSAEAWLLSHMPQAWVDAITKY